MLKNHTIISILVHPQAQGICWPNTLRRRTQRILTHPSLTEDIFPKMSLCITLTNDHEIQKLNKRYRGKNQSTDVLSFALQEGEPVYLPPDLEVPLGDVIISVDHAQKQASKGPLFRLLPIVQQRQWGVLEEISFLLLHGILHLLGYDHQQKEETQVMEKLEATLLSEVMGWKRRKHLK